jgi:hypothetical protein
VSEPLFLYVTGAPAEAVDPRTLAPGSKGRKTERSEGGPQSPEARKLGVTLPL